MKKPYTVKKSNKVRAHEPVLPLYNIPYLIYIGEKIQDAYEGMVLELGENVSTKVDANTAARALTIVHQELGTSYVILLGMESTPNILSTAAHEALHLAWWMLDDVGVEICVDNHEAQCYVMQRIFEELEVGIKDYNKTYKPKK